MKTRFLIIFLCFGGLAPGETDSLLDQAMIKLEKKDYVGALADLRRILEEPEPNPIVHYQIGVCQTLLGKYPEALDSFHRARGAGIGGWELWSGLGMAYFNLGENSRSREYFDRVLKSNPDHRTAHFYIGRIELKEGFYAQAEQKFRKVLTVDPSHDGAFFSLGRSLVLQGRIAEGKRVSEQHRSRQHLRDRLQTLQEMASSPRAPAETFVELGNVYVELGDRKNAILALERAERLKPGTLLTSLARGKISYFEGKFAAAEKYLSQYLKLRGEACDAHMFLGLSQKAQRKVDPARESLRKALEFCPRRTLLLSNLAELEIQGKNLKEARALADEILLLDPASPTGPFLVAVCRVYRKDPVGAEKWALQALQLNPNDPEHHRLLRHIYSAKGEPERAKEHAKQMQRLLQKRTSNP